MPFDKVLTLCCKCKEEIVVKASYEDRNKDFYCKECKPETDYFLEYNTYEEVDW